MHVKVCSTQIHLFWWLHKLFVTVVAWIGGSSTSALYLFHFYRWGLSQFLAVSSAWFVLSVWLGKSIPASCLIPFCMPTSHSEANLTSVSSTIHSCMLTPHSEANFTSVSSTVCWAPASRLISYHFASLSLPAYSFFSGLKFCTGTIAPKLHFEPNRNWLSILHIEKSRPTLKAFLDCFVTDPLAPLL